MFWVLLPKTPYCPWCLALRVLAPRIHTCPANNKSMTSYSGAWPCDSGVAGAGKGGRRHVPLSRR